MEGEIYVDTEGNTAELSSDEESMQTRPSIPPRNIPPPIVPRTNQVKSDKKLKNKKEDDIAELEIYVDTEENNEAATYVAPILSEEESDEGLPSVPPRNIPPPIVPRKNQVKSDEKERKKKEGFQFKKALNQHKKKIKSVIKDAGKDLRKVQRPSITASRPPAKLPEPVISEVDFDDATYGEAESDESDDSKFDIPVTNPSGDSSALGSISGSTGNSLADAIPPPLPPRPSDSEGVSGQSVEVCEYNVPSSDTEEESSEIEFELPSYFLKDHPPLIDEIIEEIKSNEENNTKLLEFAYSIKLLIDIKG